MLAPQKTTMRKQVELYGNLQLNDWLSDEYFVESRMNPTTDSDRFWQLVGEQFPHQQQNMQQAALVLKFVSQSYTPPPAGLQDAIWQKLEKASTETGLTETPVHSLPAKTIPLYRKKWLRIGAAAAVVVAGMLAVLPLLRNTDEKQITIATRFGELRKITLPDSSLVTLHGNSSIKFSDGWGKNQAREVWINGEAFLDVQHLARKSEPNKNDRFMVHLPNLEIEVLGTRFNVKSRPGSEEVVLQQGSIQVSTGKGRPTLTLKPGDAALFDPASSQPVRVTRIAERADDWTEHKYFFENTPLADVIDLLEQNFGLMVEVRNKSLFNHTLSGEITAENEKTLLTALQIMLGAQITQSGNRIIIQ